MDSAIHTTNVVRNEAMWFQYYCHSLEQLIAVFTEEWAAASCVCTHRVTISTQVSWRVRYGSAHSSFKLSIVAHRHVSLLPTGTRKIQLIVLFADWMFSAMGVWAERKSKWPWYVVADAISWCCCTIAVLHFYFLTQFFAFGLKANFPEQKLVRGRLEWSFFSCPWNWDWMHWVFWIYCWCHGQRMLVDRWNVEKYFCCHLELSFWQQSREIHSSLPTDGWIFCQRKQCLCTQATWYVLNNI